MVLDDPNDPTRAPSADPYAPVSPAAPPADAYHPAESKPPPTAPVAPSSYPSPASLSPPCSLSENLCGIFWQHESPAVRSLVCT